MNQLSVAAKVGVATVEVESVVVVVVVVVVVGFGVGIGVALALAGARLHLELVARWSPLQFLQAGLWWLQSWPLTLQSLQPPWSLE